MSNLLSCRTGFDEVMHWVATELIRAEGLHPGWPTDPIHVCGIITEECGEAMKEAIDLMWNRENSTEKLRAELVQTAAMAVRALMELE